MKGKKVIGAIVIGGLLIGGSYYVKVKSRKNPVAPPQNEVTIVTEGLDTLPGIGVTRSDLIAYFEAHDLGFMFEQVNDYQGYENYLGTSNAGYTYIQTFGIEEEVHMASINGFSKVNNDSLEVLTKEQVGEFAGFIDPTSQQRVMYEYDNAYQSGCTDYSYTQLYGSNEFLMYCQVLNGQYMLSFQVKDTRSSIQ